MMRWACGVGARGGGGGGEGGGGGDGVASCVPSGCPVGGVGAAPAAGILVCTSAMAGWLVVWRWAPVPVVGCDVMCKWPNSKANGHYTPKTATGVYDIMF